jgi:Fe-S cluster biogenesis protein NfuA
MNKGNVHMEEIKEFFQKEINYQFDQHGGGIEILSVEDNIVRFKLLGPCHNCPSAVSETEEFVATKVKERFPEIKDVILITGVSDELINMAKEILNKGKKV